MNGVAARLGSEHVVSDSFLCEKDDGFDGKTEDTYICLIVSVCLRVSLFTASQRHGLGPITMKLCVLQYRSN